MMKITKKDILICGIVSFLILFLSFQIIQSMASSFCDKTEVKPFRVIYSFWGKHEIETTTSNADGYKEFCIDKHKASFWDVNNNINYILEKSRR